MLEIIALAWLTKQIGNVLAGKGRAGGGYKVLAVVLWFAGELAGMIFGLLLNHGREAPAVYILAIVGAVIGGSAAYQIAKGVAPAAPRARAETPQA